MKLYIESYGDSPHPSAKVYAQEDFCPIGQNVGFDRSDVRKFTPMVPRMGARGLRSKRVVFSQKIWIKKCRKMFVYVAKNDYLCIILGNIYAYAYA